MCTIAKYLHFPALSTDIPLHCTLMTGCSCPLGGSENIPTHHIYCPSHYIHHIPLCTRDRVGTSQTVPPPMPASHCPSFQCTMGRKGWSGNIPSCTTPPPCPSHCIPGHMYVHPKRAYITCHSKTDSWSGVVWTHILPPQMRMHHTSFENGPLVWCGLDTRMSIPNAYASLNSIYPKTEYCHWWHGPVC